MRYHKEEHSAKRYNINTLKGRYSNIAAQVDAKNRKEALKQQEKEENSKNIEDRQIRTEIQEIIVDSICKSYSLNRILERLNEDERFTKYKDYFPSWIEEQKSKATEITSIMLDQTIQGIPKEKIIQKFAENKKRKMYIKYLPELYELAINFEKGHLLLPEIKTKLEIKKVIKEDIESEKPLLEIIQHLNSNEKYKKYGNFFEVWINEELRKKHDSINKNENVKEK